MAKDRRDSLILRLTLILRGNGMKAFVTKRFHECKALYDVMMLKRDTNERNLLFNSEHLSVLFTPKLFFFLLPSFCQKTDKSDSH